MTFLSSLAHSISAYLTHIILTLVVIAIIIMILMVIMTSTSVKNAISKKAPPKSKDEKIDTRPPEDKMPPIGGRISEFLAMRGYFRVGDLSMIFLRALDLLRQRLDTVNYKYHLPWYLLIGPSNSGKSTAMDRAEIMLPLGKLDFGVEELNPGLRWWFLNKGVVLDVRGDFLIQKRGIQADEKGWRTVISLLNRYRPRRPIDGIILTIPATELYGKEKLSPEELDDRARFLAQKLMATQNLLGLRLPVYVVITKGDTLPGFQSFAQSIPLANRNNMLGWSSPYHPSIAYTPQWIDEAFGHLHSNLNHIRLEILSAGAGADSRDGVFVFPGEINHIINPLKTYMNHIFKVSSYDETLVLRGIYLCGDSGINLELSELNAKTLSFNSQGEDENPKESVIQLPIGGIEEVPIVNPEGNRHIFFFQDVMLERVCKETGLAQPIHHRLIRANRNLNIAKASMAGFVGVSTFGLLGAYDKFSQNRDHLLPALGKVSTVLRQIPVNRFSESHATAAMFDEQTRQLISMMNNVDQTSFFSIYFPSSWFSPINHSLRSALKVSFDQIILRTIYMDLLLKAKDLLTLRPLPTDVTKSLAAQLTPTATIEYQLLKGFVERFIELSQNIEKYNSLKEGNDPGLLKDLVTYTLGIDLPDEFVRNYARFSRILKEIPYPHIELKPYQSAAQETLMVLYNHFLSNLMSPTNGNSIIGKINYILREFGQRQTEQLPDLMPLRVISKDLNDSLNVLGSDGNNWIDSAYFDPGSGFSDLMGLISDFPVFGSGVVNEFAGQTAVVYANFQRELRRLNDYLIDRSITPIGKTSYPSDGLVALQKSLTLLFAQDFMAQPAPATVLTNVAENQVVYWNSKLIDTATEMAKKYEEYHDKTISEFPPILRQTLKLTARQNLLQNILSLIAKSQTVAPASEGATAAASAEETLRNKIADVREISPKLSRLLQVMNDGGLGTNYVALRDTVGTLSTRLLVQVDKVFEGYQLYKTRGGNFDWWDGKVSPIMDGFNLRDERDMETYLEQQRSVIRNLALEYAKYMVDFLTSAPMRDYNGNSLLVNKWKRIIEQVTNYDKKSPDNSIAALEVSIAKELMNVDLKKCFTAIPLREVKKTSGDYFVNRRVELRREILGRCEVLRRQQSISNYQTLAGFFNDNLKQKFPFATRPGRNTVEAEPEDIREFFRMYKEFGDNPKDLLDQVYQMGGNAKPMYEFLTNMDKVKIFFDSFLNAKPQAESPVFDFKVDFRVNVERESNGNMIIDWKVLPNETTEVTNYDKVRLGKWTVGDQFNLTLKWPEVSQLQPYRDPAQPYLDVTDGVATFSYPGKWSLLWLIRGQLASGTDYNTVKDGTPYVLKFVIPNAPAIRTVVYNRITLLAPGVGDKPGRPMTMPAFPSQAPEIPQDVLQVANESVLVKGAVEDYNPDESEQAQELPEEETNEPPAETKPAAAAPAPAN